MTAGSWSSAHLTNGVVRPQDLAALGGSPELAAELVSAGLWEKRRGGGWKFHEWEKKNPTRQEVEKDRKDAAERQRKSRARNRHNGAVDNDGNERSRSPGDTASRRDSHSDNGVSHTTPTRRVGRTESHPPDPSGAASRANPAGSPARAKPPWCGECDQDTRMLDPDRPRRCPRCHPLSEAGAP